MIQLTSSKMLRWCCVVLLALTGAAATRAQSDGEPTPFSFAEASLRGPAVASVLERPRDTPATQLHAIFTLFDLGELDVAEALWKELASDGVDDNSKAELVRRFGTARFLNLARRETPASLVGARQFAESCLKAAGELSRQPERLAKLISDLGNESAEVRRAARSDLAVTGDVGAIACLEALAQSADQDNNVQLRTELMLTLANMRPSVESMLIAALADGRGQFRRDVAELTGHLHLQEAVPWLAAIASGSEDDPTVVSAAIAALSKMGLSSPNVDEVRAVLRSEIRRLEALTVVGGSETTWWIWHHQTPPQTDPGPGKMASGQYPEEMVHKLAINRLSAALNSLGVPTLEDLQTQLIYSLETASTVGMAEDFDLSPFSTQQLSSALAAAMRQNQIAAAIACARGLGSRPDDAPLRSFAGEKSPLASALVHGDRELRYTALEAVMKINPQSSFAGASGVPATLWYFAASAGTPQVIAASPVVARASDWAGQLRGLGFDATPVTTGRDAMLTALGSPRLELILVDSDIGRPLVREVIFQLRSHPQVARVPIAILSSLHNLPHVQQIAAQDPLLLAVARPHDDAAMKSVLGRLSELSGTVLTAERRTHQAAAALGWIANLLEEGHPYDELLRDARRVSQTLYNPDLTSASLQLLAVLGTADSQQLLLDYVSTAVLPIKSRQEAGEALAQSVDRFGKLLTSEEILRQYDRYNASETADRETQQVLGRVLDILEK